MESMIDAGVHFGFPRAVATKLTLTLALTLILTLALALALTLTLTRQLVRRHMLRRGCVPIFLEKVRVID